MKIGGRWRKRQEEPATGTVRISVMSGDRETYMTVDSTCLICIELGDEIEQSVKLETNGNEIRLRFTGMK
ncbi:MAG: hypothetical protein F4X47_05570 [Gammaproteobacteria bacterium]|nr:hypothetical protein [Gammaproteobacteria bacterium]MYC51770.1 hypothetical protein [Gammaproteobacteria bacterium]